MSAQERAAIVADCKGAMAGRIDADRDYSMEEVVEIKYWFFGGSARYMFGLTMTEALKDLKKYVNKINDAELVFQGLTGSPGPLSVNHIISHFPDTEDEFRPLSSYVIDLLSKKLGFAAIKMFYRSTWVRGNPSVHGFVFEWDLFTQIKMYRKLTLSSNQDGGMDTTWTVDEDIGLMSFLAGTRTSTAARIMVRPEKWNHPEYDGLYIHTNQQNERELVAWNASEAVTHTGSVTKLRLLLQEIGNRSDCPLIFENVRFVFIVPTENIGTFQLPSDSVQLLARQQLTGWRFSGFEILGGRRTVDEYAS